MIKAALSVSHTGVPAMVYRRRLPLEVWTVAWQPATDREMTLEIAP
jgi:hypothetical protein